MLRICRECGAEYEGDPTTSLCRICVQKAKKSTIRQRTCRECGCSFPGGPHAWYCPDCRAERRREQDRNNKKKGAQRHLGSIDYCIVCGGEYIVNSGRQKYCPKCAPEAIAEIDRAQGRAWNAANIDPEERRQLRKNHTAKLICPVCGNLFIPRYASKTCSAECAAAHRKQAAKEFERTHRAQRSEQQKAYLHKRLQAMTPDEREAYRLETNRRARENYHKRKLKKENDK